MLAAKKAAPWNSMGGLSDKTRRRHVVADSLTGPHESATAERPRVPRNSFSEGAETTKPKKLLK
jgi:hypothetical protein